MEQLGPEHHLEVRPMGDGELDVGDADVEEGAIAPCRVEGVAEQPVAVDGDRCEQAGLVAEVVCRGRVRDAGSPGDAAQRQGHRPGFLDRRDGVAQQRGAQVAVVVGPV